MSGPCVSVSVVGPELEKFMGPIKLLLYVGQICWEVSLGSGRGKGKDVAHLSAISVTYISILNIL